jgi:hypothetical protein
MSPYEQIVVFRTGSLVEFDTVTGALKQARVPFFSREESSGGMRLATPAAPSVGPGTWWAVLVPAPAAEDARDIIRQLPLSEKTDPDVWDFQPTKRARMGWKVYAAASLLILLLSALLELIRKLW